MVSAKGTVTANVNFFMNVPITSEGELAIVDGLSAPGGHVDLRAEMDVLVVFSNCPQVNNPCNGFNPTPIRVLIWDGPRWNEPEARRSPRVSADVYESSGREPGRDRRPRHRHAAPHGRVVGGRLLRRRPLHPPVREADEAVRIGPPAAAESYLDLDAIVAACIATGAEAVHPGYGFLSEKPEFPEALAAAGIRFIGPDPAHMRAFGLKHTARALPRPRACRCCRAAACSSMTPRPEAAAQRIGYPVMLKSTAGGGGIGMRIYDRTYSGLRGRDLPS